MMTFHKYAERRLGLSHLLVETYEEERQAEAALDREREELLEGLRRNFQKFKALHENKEIIRRGIQDSIDRLEAEYAGKEVAYG